MYHSPTQRFFLMFCTDYFFREYLAESIWPRRVTDDPGAVHRQWIQQRRHGDRHQAKEGCLRWSPLAPWRTFQPRQLRRACLVSRKATRYGVVQFSMQKINETPFLSLLLFFFLVCAPSPNIAWSHHQWNVRSTAVNKIMGRDCLIQYWDIQYFSYRWSIQFYHRIGEKI